MNLNRILTLAALVLLVPFAAHAADAPNPIFKGKKVLLVAAITSDTAKVDANIKAHFESLGMTVNMVSDINPPAPDGYDLVYITSDTKAKTILYIYRTTTVPVYTAKPWLLEFLGMVDMVPQKDYGEDEKEEQSFTYLQNAPNPLQAGLPNGLLVPVKHAIKLYNWGRPERSAQVVATFPGEPDKGFIFGYEKGVYMSESFTAPARRVFFGIAPDQFDILNDNGMKLFDACAAWALGSK